MRVDYHECHTAAEAAAYLRRFEPRTVIVDVEPLIAHWNSGDRALLEGLSSFAGQVEQILAVDTIVFATNSRRRPSSVPSGTQDNVLYVANAFKPLRTAPFRALPKPGVVVGDHYCTAEASRNGAD